MSNNVWMEIIDSIKILVAFFGTLVAIYKAFENLQEQKTKRAEIQAKENSVGAAALALIKTEIEHLTKANTDGQAKIETVNQAVKNLQFIIEMIEKRMTTIFSGNRNI